LSPAASDWIGLYESAADGDSERVGARFTNGRASGSLSLTIPDNARAGTTNEVRLFNNGRRVAKSDSFTVAVPALSVTPTRVGRGAAVTATWTNIARPAATDWIGLYSSSVSGNSSYLAYIYTRGTTNGSAALIIPPHAPFGTVYELRLFTSNGSTGLVSNTFRVEAARLSVGPTPVLPGRSVTATWGLIPDPTPRDWIGLYPSSSAPDSPSLAWTYIFPTTTGSVPFEIPAATAPGTTYELRLFSNNGYSRLSTSETFTVQAPQAATGSN
jgi:hypothetical protein